MKTIVVKVGSSTVADDSLRIRRRLLAGLAADIAELVHGGRRVVLGLERRHRLRAARARRQRAAAAGARAAGGLRRRPGPPVRPLRAPVRRSRAHRRPGAAHQRGLRAGAPATSTRATRCAVCSTWGVVPVVNENDTTATDEIRFGDNDVLAAQVAIMLRADLLVLLTDQDGLYTEGSAQARRRGAGPPRHRPGGARRARRRRRVPPRRRRHARQDRRGAHGRRGRRAHRHRQRLAAWDAPRGGRRRRQSGRWSCRAPPAPPPSSSGCATPSRCVVRLMWTPGQRVPWRRGGAVCFPWASRRCTARSRPATP